MTGGLIKLANTALEGLNNLYVPVDDLEAEIGSLSVRTILSASAILIALVIFGAIINKRAPKLKKPVFILIIITVLTGTLVISGSTVYLNTKSDSGGPVHWHADMEVWACGNELELRDPVGFSNKIGTSTLHEHDDHRIHLEGVVVDDKLDASLGKFMHVIDGGITNEALVVPLNDTGYFENEVDGDGAPDKYGSQLEPFIVKNDKGTFARFVSGEKCGDDAAEVQVFVLKYDERSKTYHQEKLANPKDYVIAPQSLVPPGDCVIVEFSSNKDKTDKLCEQYGVRDIDRCEQFGVGPTERKVCEIRQVEKGSR